MMTNVRGMEDLWKVKDNNSRIAYGFSTSTDKLRDFFSVGANEVERKINEFKKND